MTKIVKALSILATSSAIICLPVFSASAANTANTTINATVNSVISLSIADQDIDLNLTPTVGGSDSDTASHTVLVSTNNAAGYNLSLKGSTQLSKGSNHINAVSGNTTLSNNTWGYHVGTSGNNFRGVTTGGAQIKTTSSTANNDSTTVTYGARVNSSLPTGTYTGTVTYTATAK